MNNFDKLTNEQLIMKTLECIIWKLSLPLNQQNNKELMELVNEIKQRLPNE
jgi:5-methylcytosine-specific restriction endonuclease McrBC regulatory subunit McrC